jgi:hypothetical protein
MHHHPIAQLSHLSPVPKGTDLGWPRKETNQSGVVFTSYIFGIRPIQANANQVLSHPEDLSFISARPGKLGSYYFFQEGNYSKTVLRRGREGLNVESQEVNIFSLFSPFTISTASPRFSKE